MKQGERPTADCTAPVRFNGNKHRPNNNGKSENELSDSHSTAAVNELRDDIVVSGRNTRRGLESTACGAPARNEDEMMEDVQRRLHVHIVQSEIILQSSTT